MTVLCYRTCTIVCFSLAAAYKRAPVRLPTRNHMSPLPSYSRLSPPSNPDLSTALFSSPPPLPPMATTTLTLSTLTAAKPMLP